MLPDTQRIVFARDDATGVVRPQRTRWPREIEVTGRMLRYIEGTPGGPVAFVKEKNKLWRLQFTVANGAATYQFARVWRNERGDARFAFTITRSSLDVTEGT